MFAWRYIIFYLDKVDILNQNYVYILNGEIQRSIKMFDKKEFINNRIINKRKLINLQKPGEKLIRDKKENLGLGSPKENNW